MTETSFPRQHARTRRFTLGVPRDFVISPDGKRVLFTRSRSGVDPVNLLWEVEVATGEERLVVDPATLLTGGHEELPPEERARRERVRETSEGIVRLVTDDACEQAVFDLGGHLYGCRLATGEVIALPTAGPAVDPTLDPTGRRVAYVAGEALHVMSSAGDDDCLLLAGENPSISYGLAEFVAAEEMDRYRGYWWSPDGEQIVAARVDTTPVRRAYINDPAHPEQPPVEVAYPFAGTENALVTLVIVDVASASGTSGGPGAGPSGGTESHGSGQGLVVRWDRAAYEYVVRVDWTLHGLFVLVASRDQRRSLLLEVDTATGGTTVVREDADDDWVDIINGIPSWLDDGTLVWASRDSGAYRLVIGDEPVTPVAMNLRSVLDIDGDRVVFSASAEPTEVRVYEWSRNAGLTEIGGGSGESGELPVVRGARSSGGTTLLVERSLDRHGASATIIAGRTPVGTITSLEETPVLSPNVRILRAGENGIRTALLLPTGHQEGSGKLPVLLDPYGGPGAQRVLATRSIFLTSQWFADQGFAVIVADGRGTPGRGPAWDRSIHYDFAGPVLDDQITALAAASAACPDLDLSRVAIRGWSFGGYLAALAVLRRPDVFHVAVAGAPVTDMALYDTHYTERYLGTPEADPEAYERVSLLRDAHSLSRPLLVIHGLADDNVLVAHTLQLSALLTAAGRPHTVLPLVGVTHMTPQEEVAENLLLLQLRFIRDAFAAMDAVEER